MTQVEMNVFKKNKAQVDSANDVQSLHGEFYLSS